MTLVHTYLPRYLIWSTSDRPGYRAVRSSGLVVLGAESEF
jgi:hypothetical protein